MAKILCVTSCQPALLYPGVELSRRLVAAGHRVIYASSPGARPVVERHGIDFLALEPSRYDEFLAGDEKVGTLARLFDIEGRQERALESLGAREWRRMVGDLRPDLILIEGEMHEQIIAAWSSEAPIALLNSFVSIWRSPGVPPPHCEVRPGVGWRGTRAWIWLLWQVLRLRKAFRRGSQKVRRLGCDRLSILRRLAVECGFDLSRETDAGQWLIPFTYRRLPVLSLHAEEFEFPHRSPDRVRYIGPLVLEERDDERFTESLMSELGELFESCRRNERTLIYAAFGSYFTTDLDLVRRLIIAVEGRGDWELLISLGGRLEPESLGELPERVHAFGWLPQVEILRHADLAVIHGGITTVDECVLNAVPMLVYCGAETDMAGTTARVVHHGIGISGDSVQDGPEVIRAQLERLLLDRGVAANLAGLRERYEAYAEQRVAERGVEDLLEAALARRET